jgi:hypothetical protein
MRRSVTHVTLCDADPVRRLSLTALATALAAALMAGCGSATVGELPPGARPARSPALAEAPAGRVLRIGRHPVDVVADPTTRTFIVAERDPEALRFVDAATGRIRDRVTPAPHATENLYVVPYARAPVDAIVLPYRPSAAAGGRVFVADGRSVRVQEGSREVARFGVGAEPGSMAPADRGRLLAVVSRRERTLSLYDPRSLQRVAVADAGVGPTTVIAEADRLYVADTAGGALLVFQVHPKLTLTRRVDLPGGPYGLAVDTVRHRLWVTLTQRNLLVSLPANGRPHPLDRLPTVRQPDHVAVVSALGTVAVSGGDAGVLQLVGAHDGEFAGAVLHRPVGPPG